MMNSDQKVDQLGVKARLRDLLKDMLVFLESASEDQQLRLLKSLEDFDGEERRRHPRKTCSIQVSVGTWRVFREFIRDMSCGGVFIQTGESFSPGEHITLTFSPANKDRAVRITGRVVRRTSQGIGVEFTGPPSHELEKIIESL